LLHRPCIGPSAVSDCGWCGEIHPGVTGNTIHGAAKCAA
jgi:hypothetical protein